MNQDGVEMIVFLIHYPIMRTRKNTNTNRKIFLKNEIHKETHPSSLLCWRLHVYQWYAVIHVNEFLCYFLHQLVGS